MNVAIDYRSHQAVMALVKRCILLGQIFTFRSAQRNVNTGPSSMLATQSGLFSTIEHT